MTDTQNISDIFGLLIDESSLHVLLLKDEAGNWTLPHVRLDRRVYLHQVGIIAAEMDKLLTADITVLRSVYVQIAPDSTSRVLIYQLENHSADWMPAAAEWIAQDAIAALPMTQPDQRALIAEILAEVASRQVPALRPPWARPGWFDAASTWMRGEVVKHGYTLTSPITQLKSWGISCLLKAETDQGTVFFKVATALPLFGNEPALLSALAKRYPDAVPAPLAVESNERWMLMRDFGTELNAAPTFDKWFKALERYGQLQAKTAAAVDDLFGVGCLDRRLNVLSSQIDPLFADDQVLSPLLSPDEIAQIRALAPRLKQMCSELAQFRVPHTLAHGDFHGGNVTGESLLFFDWTDACIAHPFLDLCTVMENLEGQKIDGREQVLDTYFQAWTQYEPMERLHAAWKLAEPLGALHQAVSYQHIVATLEPTSKREMIWGVPEWLQRMLRTMPS